MREEFGFGILFDVGFWEFGISEFGFWVSDLGFWGCEIWNLEFLLIMLDS